MTPRVLGVDGCKGGWIGIALDGDRVAAYFEPEIGALVTRAAADGEIAVVGIDIPIGLVKAGVRAADLEARKQLGVLRRSVFMTPVEAAIREPDYQKAVAINRDLAGQGISKQAHGLRKRILEVDEWAKTAEPDVIEVHPEVSFAAMAGRPLKHSKRTWAGIEERRRLLAEAGVQLPSELGAAGARAGVDDVLDAAAAVWTGRRFGERGARRLPEEPQDFEDTLRYTIWV